MRSQIWCNHTHAPPDIWLTYSFQCAASTIRSPTSHPALPRQSFSSSHLGFCACPFSVCSSYLIHRSVNDPLFLFWCPLSTSWSYYSILFLSHTSSSLTLQPVNPISFMLSLPASFFLAFYSPSLFLGYAYNVP